ncbi:MAG: type II toxin-antitoxin system HicB family antitoxin [Pseudomonadota bacterium]
MEFVLLLERDSNGSLLATCAAVPAFASVGDDEDEVLLNALDGMETALEFYINDRLPVPVPAPRKLKKGETVLRLPAQVAAKVLLHNEMLAQGVRKAELARRLHMHMPQVDRLLNVRHSTRLDTLEEAAQALGKRLTISVA